MSAIPQAFGPFDQGVNFVDAVSKLGKSELSFGLNCRTTRRGRISKRPGHGRYGSAPVAINGNNLVNLNARFYKADGTRITVCASNGKLFRGNDNTGAWTPINIDGNAANGMNTVDICDYMYYKDRMYIADGIKPQRYDGTNNIYAGLITPPIMTAAQVAIAAGLAVGTYKYVVTCVQGDLGESIISAPVTVVVTNLTNNQINLTNIVNAAAKFGQTEKRIYRTKANGSIYYFLTTILGAAGATVYNDIAVDTALGNELVLTENPPTDARFVVMGNDDRAYWFGMAGVNASLVKISDVGFPDRIVSATGFLSVQNNDSDIITGYGKTPGGIIFFKRSSIFQSRGFGYGLIPIEVKDDKSGGIGSVAPWSIVNTPNGLFFLSQKNKVYKFDGTNLDDIGQNIQTIFTGITEGGLNKVTACYHDDRYIISFDHQSAKGYNWRTMEYDVINNKWDGPHENGDLYTPSCYCVWDSRLDAGELTWGEGKPANGSFLLKRTIFTRDDRGTKFISTWRTGKIPLGMLGDVLTIKMFLQGEYYPDAAITIRHIDDYGVIVQEQLTTPVLNLVAKWSSGYKWSSGNKWTGKYYGILEAPLADCRAKTPQFEVSDNGSATEFNIDIMTGLLEILPLA